ncbi:type II toxin-antitoxin system RelE/ParE family toxin [bacterium]|nr:MAG: type II toxin-antitoxin system RelE/ParE family toxin [bacterium]
MAYKVVLTDPAAADIDEAVTFIESYSVAASANWLETIQEAIESLSEMPSRGAFIRENTGQGFEYRHLIYKNHRIVYRVDEAAQSVLVVRVYHSARTLLRTQDME